MPRHTEHYWRTKELVDKYLDSDLAQKLRMENYLADAPVANDDDEEFADIDKMFAEDENIVSMTHEEVLRGLSVWRAVTTTKRPI